MMLTYFSASEHGEIKNVTVEFACGKEFDVYLLDDNHDAVSTEIFKSGEELEIKPNTVVFLKERH